VCNETSRGLRMVCSRKPQQHFFDLYANVSINPREVVDGLRVMNPPAGCAWFVQGSPQQSFCDLFVNVLINPREVGGELHVDRRNLPQVSQDRWE